MLYFMKVNGERIRKTTISIDNLFQKIYPLISIKERAIRAGKA